MQIHAHDTKKENEAIDFIDRWRRRRRRLEVGGSMTRWYDENKW